jgi:diguanylate cyclase (GGDEF)-like protein/PAS domain S-box-containing protein
MSDDNKTSGTPASIHQSFETGADSSIFQPLLDHIQNGVAHCRMLYEEGQPSDFIYLYTNPAFEQLTGLKQITGKRVTEVIPGIRESDPELFNIYGSVAAGNGPVKFESYIKALDMWFSVSVYSPKHEHFVAIFDVITERKQLELKSQFLASIIQSSEDAILSNDLKGIITSWNSGCQHLFGYTAEEMVGQSLLKLSPPDRVDEEQFIMFEISSGHRIDHFETLRLGKNGLPIDVSVTMSPIFDQAGKVIGASKIARNITDRKIAEEKIRLSSSVFEHAGEGILITTTDGTIVDVNNAFSRITGFSRDEVLGKNPRILGAGTQDNCFYTELWTSLIEKGHWYGEIWNRHKDGGLYAVIETISVVRNSLGVPRHYVAMLTDITHLKEHENELVHIAHYDALTSLPNRSLLADRMRQAMAQVQRRNQSMAVVFLDLDGFKQINDKNGHEAGDRLLIAVATRMEQALRDGDTLARIGGDEFVAILLDLDSEATIIHLLNRLLAAASESVTFGDLNLKVTASLGVTFYPLKEDIDADQLLRQADQAMYQAKLTGKNRYHIFDAALDNNIRIRHESLDRIRVAIIEQEFVLLYQPKVNMRTGAIIGAEALIRWQHPEKGFLSPTTFLTTIEDHPMAVRIGEWVIDMALTQVALWRKQGLDIPISVNIGAHQLQQTDFITRLREILAAHPEISPSYLELEVLETNALEDLAMASNLIEACRKIGVNFALDDFGTGYSSLTYLKRLPVTCLKIDQSFVRNMLDDPDDLAIIAGVVGLASTFHLHVIAEGVEAVEHGTMLLQLGCELAQGYGIARPMPADQLPDWSTTWRPDSIWTCQTIINRDNLPRLFARVEQRHWIASIDSFLKDERDLPIELDYEQSYFGMWINAVYQVNLSTQPTLDIINFLHQQIQALCTELSKLHDSNRKSEALARLDELHDLRDALLEELKIPA